MERLWQRHPQINFRIAEAGSSVLLTRELPERQIDLALVPLVGAVVPDDQEAAILFHDRLRVVVGTKSPWARRRGVTLADLVNEPWCVARSAIGSLVTDAFGASGLPAPRVAVTSTSAHVLFQLLESGRYVGHFGDEMLRFYTDRFALKKLAVELPAKPFSVAVVTLKNRTISPVAQLFIDCAREVAATVGRRPSRHSERSQD
jgi:DNA-binding transcriptional LysR family regulator